MVGLVEIGTRDAILVAALLLLWFMGERSDVVEQFVQRWIAAFRGTLGHKTSHCATALDARGERPPQPTFAVHKSRPKLSSSALLANTSQTGLQAEISSPGRARQFLRGLGVRLLIKPVLVKSVIRHCRWCIFSGLLLAFVASRTDGFGIATAIMVSMLGAYGGAFGWWQHDRGLWMLSALFLVMTSLLYAGFTYGEIQEIIRGHGRIAEIVDLSAATSVLGVHARFLLTVTVLNRKKLNEHANQGDLQMPSPTGIPRFSRSA